MEKNHARKVCILKSRVKNVCVLASLILPFSIEAKWVKSIRTGGDKSINNMCTCMLTVLPYFKEPKEKKTNNEKRWVH